MKLMGFRSDLHPLAVRPGHVTQGLCVAVPESGEGRWAGGMGRPRGGRRWPPALSSVRSSCPPGRLTEHRCHGATGTCRLRSEVTRSPDGWFLRCKEGPADVSAKSRTVSILGPASGWSLTQLGRVHDGRGCANVRTCTRGWGRWRVLDIPACRGPSALPL